MPTLSSSPGIRGVGRFLALMLAFPLGAQAQIDFRGFGVLPGATSSEVTGVSADGGTVVGMMHIPAVPPALADSWAIRWTFAAGAEHLVPPSQFSRASVAGVSGDGSVIVGDIFSSGPGHGFYWTRETGFVTQQALHTFAVSDDGVYDFGQYLIFFEPHRRRLSDGSSEVLGPRGYVTGASSDGNIVIGGLGPVDGGAWRWTESSGQVSLGSLPDGMGLSEPLDITPDGSVVVGRLTDGMSDTPFRWSESAGYELLAMLADSLGAVATDVAADGRTAVGYTQVETDVRRAAIWLSDGTVQDLGEYLGSLGAPPSALDGWTLTAATGISDDGLTIAGDGINPNGIAEGWVVRIPSPATGALFLSPVFIQRRRRGRAGAAV